MVSKGGIEEEIPILDMLCQIRTSLQEAKKQIDPSIFEELPLNPLEIENLGALRDNLECLEVLNQRAIRTLGSIVYLYRVVEREKPLSKTKKVKRRKGEPSKS